MNSARSVRPCSDSAASCQPAIQPSVRASSVAIHRLPGPVHHLVQERRRLIIREAQLGGAQFG